MKIITIAMSMAVFSWVVSRPYEQQPRVTASWYGEQYRGNVCADNKTIFNPDDPKQAAHRSYPFGSVIRVSLTKDKYIDVTIVDRGPFVKDKNGKYTREIDLSRAAFQKLSDPSAGLLQVKLTKLR